ncbi:MAG: DNA polymerase III subunit delta [Lachnospiraceae bacterium]|nr:DNA polymerase III subunit delta [Lachnospiraceae bacterium]
MAGFDSIIGQEQIRDHMAGAIASGHVGHAYIINGEKSSGKEYIAGLFAKALQCTGEGEKPCCKCPSCMQAESGNQPDIIYVSHEKPGSIGVDDVRDQICNDISIRPYSSEYKIYICNEAEKMTPAAQNALLKTLEEPPAYGIIFLLTTSVDALLPTIQSRCITLNMKPVRDDQMRKYLTGELGMSSDKADMCIAFARGNVGKAKLLACSEEFDKVRTEALSLLRNIREMDIADVAGAVKQISEYKFETTDYLDIISIWYRDVLMFKATRDAGNLIFHDEIQYITRIADRSTYEGIETIIDAIEKAKSRIRANVSYDLAIELLMLTIQENS